MFLAAIVLPNCIITGDVISNSAQFAENLASLQKLLNENFEDLNLKMNADVNRIVPSSGWP